MIRCGGKGEHPRFTDLSGDVVRGVCQGRAPPLNRPRPRPRSSSVGPPFRKSRTMTRTIQTPRKEPVRPHLRTCSAKERAAIVHACSVNRRNRHLARHPLQVRKRVLATDFAECAEGYLGQGSAWVRPAIPSAHSAHSVAGSFCHCFLRVDTGTECDDQGIRFVMQLV